MNGAVFAAAFVALYVGHMVGDHLVQTDWQAQNKASRGWIGAQAMAGHLTGYLICQMAALAALLPAGVPLNAVAVYAGSALSVVSHGFIDRRWPVRWLLEHTGSKPFARLASSGINGMYLADQSLHIGCLFIAALLISGGSQ